MLAALGVADAAAGDDAASRAAALRDALAARAAPGTEALARAVLVTRGAAGAVLAAVSGKPRIRSGSFLWDHLCTGDTKVARLEKSCCIDVEFRTQVLATADGVAELAAAPPPAAVVNANGAGDALCGVAAAAFLRGAPLDAAVAAGLEAAARVVARDAAAPDVDAAWLDGVLDRGL